MAHGKGKSGERKKIHSRLENRTKLSKSMDIFRKDRIRVVAKTGPERQRFGRSLAQLALSARMAAQEFETRKVLINANPVDVPSSTRQFHASHAYYREYRKVVEAADVILFVLDARDPAGTRSIAIENAIQSEFVGRKPVILVMNKSDLIPRHVAAQWVSYFSRQNIQSVPFCASMKEKAGLAKLLRMISTVKSDLADAGVGTGKSAVGRSHTTIGVVGYPNVGKSSLINALASGRRDGHEVVRTGAMPGLTTAMQKIDISSAISVVDCPGVLFNAESDPHAAVLRGATAIDSIDDPVSAAVAAFKVVPRKHRARLFATYDVDTSVDGVEEADAAVAAAAMAAGASAAAWRQSDDPVAAAHAFLRRLCLRRGKLLKGGEADTPAAARLVLHDWASGKIPFYSHPPGFDEDGDAAMDDDDVPGHVVTGANRTGGLMAAGARAAVSEFMAAANAAGDTITGGRVGHGTALPTVAVAVGARAKRRTVAGAAANRERADNAAYEDAMNGMVRELASELTGGAMADDGDDVDDGEYGEYGEDDGDGDGEWQD